jgi:NADH:ubiquinone oxidoreductase subunit B-like Fe-S oxidoreductase
MLHYPFFAASCCRNALNYKRLYSTQTSYISIALSPSHTSILIVFGILSKKQAPLITDAYEQLLLPKKVIYFKGCHINTTQENYVTLENLVPVNEIMDQCNINQNMFEDYIKGINKRWH